MASPSLWARIRAQSPVTKRVALNLVGFATWIPVIAFFNMHVAELTVVSGASMYPFLNEDKDSSLTRDLLLTYKWSPQDNLERGMVVTLRYVVKLIQPDSFVFISRLHLTQMESIFKLTTFLNTGAPCIQRVWPSRG